MNTGIGMRVPRKEDGRHLAGKAQFVGDLKLPGLWEAAYVRSPLAHARIKSITKPAGAEGQIFTMADMAGLNPISARSTLPGYKRSDHCRWPRTRCGSLVNASPCAWLRPGQRPKIWRMR